MSVINFTDTKKLVLTILKVFVAFDNTYLFSVNFSKSSAQYKSKHHVTVAISCLGKVKCIKELIGVTLLNLFGFVPL